MFYQTYTPQIQPLETETNFDAINKTKCVFHKLIEPTSRTRAEWLDKAIEKCVWECDYSEGVHQVTCPTLATKETTLELFKLSNQLPLLKTIEPPLLIYSALNQIVLRQEPQWIFKAKLTELSFREILRQANNYAIEIYNKAELFPTEVCFYLANWNSELLTLEVFPYSITPHLKIFAQGLKNFFFWLCFIASETKTFKSVAGRNFKRCKNCCYPPLFGGWFQHIFPDVNDPKHDFCIMDDLEFYVRLIDWLSMDSLIDLVQN